MTRTKSTKRALLSSALALFLCFSMLLGTTFAWFTDEVTSAGNMIMAGSLQIDLLHKIGANEWKSLDENPDHKIFNYDRWEPGYTRVEVLKAENLGSLALQYKLSLTFEEGSATLGANGENLADVIGVYVSYGEYTDASYAEIKTNGKWSYKGTLTEVMASPLSFIGGELLPEGKTLEANSAVSTAEKEQTVSIALHMDEEAGNGYQKLSLGNVYVTLTATQWSYENDAFGSDYDQNAAADFYAGFQGGSAGAAVNSDADGKTTEEVTMDGGDVSAVIPTGVQVADGTTSLKLDVTLKTDSESNIQLAENEKMRPVDVHIEGVAQGNTVPMLITLKHYLTTGINTGAIKMYHVENGVTVPMTQVATPVNHNEFSYDPMTGDVTLALASFSEVAVVADTNNPWDGKTLNYLWYDASAAELTIYNADQLAGFAAIVDGNAEGIEQDSFANKTVKLANNIYLSGKLFEPIGWGYEYKDWNVGDQPGKPFKGTFDGNGKTILDLYQSGWDLTNAGTGEAYTYTNCGFGLFAAAADATFKNLTIYGADIRVECVETGILVGLSQGSCNYENIIISNSKAANYQRPVGGLIGEISPLNGGGTTTITNVEIGSDVVIGSLWGDFDAPCGGVIGARWDDSNTTTVNMKDVTVGCRMDVYSDVTSAYQWYAYRRAGMLIGNTDQVATGDRHTAAADFLTCKNVKVYYGNWTAYNYYQFINQDNSWCNNYPWVRAEEGENCSAFSNPRYGQPVVKDVKINSQKLAESNKTDYVTIHFNQLYGGGQGVYGKQDHPGVTVSDYRYSITYINDYDVLSIIYVTQDGAVNTENRGAQELVEKWAADNITGTWEFGGWMNAGSTKLTQIDANNTNDIVLYPYFKKPYTARFVDQNGNVVAYCFFHAEDLNKLDTTKDAARNLLPDPGKLFQFDYWEVNASGTKVKYDKKNFANYGYDVTIYPVYRYTGNLKLTPVDEGNDGTIDYYKVEAVDELDAVTTIPGYVNGVPVKLVEKLYKNDDNWDFGSGVTTIIIEEGVEELAHNSLGYTKDLDVVYLPSTINKLNKNTFSRNTGDDKKVLKIIYNGTGDDFKKVMDNSVESTGFLSADLWYGGLKVNSTVECTDGTYTLTKAGGIGSKGTWTWTPNPN